MTVKEGIQFAKAMSYFGVNMFSDSKFAADWLNGVSSMSWFVKFLISDELKDSRAVVGFMLPEV